MILHGIEYQRPTSLNMRIMADHVTYSFLAFMKSIFHFCLGCYCGGYSQNGRSNLSSLKYRTALKFPRRLDSGAKCSTLREAKKGPSIFVLYRNTLLSRDNMIMSSNLLAPRSSLYFLAEYTVASTSCYRRQNMSIKDGYMTSGVTQ